MGFLLDDSIPQFTLAVAKFSLPTGLDQRVFDSLNQLNFPYLVYISCDTATFARDTKKLITAGFILEEVTPIDMFPQTYHIEQIALYVRN